jgi:hypothetical protein
LSPTVNIVRNYSGLLLILASHFICVTVCYVK